METRTCHSDQRFIRAYTTLETAETAFYVALHFRGRVHSLFRRIRPNCLYELISTTTPARVTRVTTSTVANGEESLTARAYISL
jgi:hypothetical protein